MHKRLIGLSFLMATRSDSTGRITLFDFLGDDSSELDMTKPLPLLDSTWGLNGGRTAAVAGNAGTAPVDNLKMQP